MQKPNISTNALVFLNDQTWRTVLFLPHFLVCSGSASVSSVVDVAALQRLFHLQGRVDDLVLAAAPDKNRTISEKKKSVKKLEFCKTIG